MTPDLDAVRAMMEGLKQMIALADELCTAVDCEAEDIGGQRKPITILRELGQSAEKANAARELVPALAAEVEANRATIAGLEARVEALTADAALWRGLMSCQRVRTMGFTKDMNHIGMEFWREHPESHPSVNYPQEACRGRITEFARAALSGGTTDAR